MGVVVGHKFPVWAWAIPGEFNGVGWGLMQRDGRIRLKVRGQFPASGKKCSGDDLHSLECHVFSVHIIYLLVNQH